MQQRGRAIWRLNSVKSRAHDMSAQNSIRARKTILAREPFLYCSKVSIVFDCGQASRAFSLLRV